MNVRCDISTACVLNVCKANGYCIVKNCSFETKKEVKDFVEGREQIKLIGYTSDSVLGYVPILKGKEIKAEKPPIHNVRFFTKESECYYCKVSLNEKIRTRDHLHPKSKGGKLNNLNKIFACRTCNYEKADMTIGEWLEKLKSESLNGRTETIISTLNHMIPKLKTYEKTTLTKKQLRELNYKNH